MTRARWLLPLLFAACTEANPCVAVVAQGCAMARAEAARPGGDPAAVEVACQAAQEKAASADADIQARCADDPASFRSPQRPSAPASVPAGPSSRPAP